MIPSVLEDDDARERAGDILEEERARRLRRRRGIRKFWPGVWLSGASGMVILAVFVLGGAALAGYQWIFQNPERLAAPADSRVPQRARDLTASEYSMASVFGTPLFMGDGGLPVIRVESTGQVREITPVEIDFDSTFEVRVTDRGRIIEIPGPRGWGMWWRDTSMERSLMPQASFDRIGWARKQESELNRAYEGIAIGMMMLTRVDLDAWERGYGQLLQDIPEYVRGQHPPARHGLWSGVPDQWVCDMSLDLDLNQGVSRGCPGEDYNAALREGWSQIGLIVDRMEEIGRLVHHFDRMNTADLHESHLRNDLIYVVLDLNQDFLNLQGYMKRIMSISGEWDLKILVDLTGGF